MSSYLRTIYRAILKYKYNINQLGVYRLRDGRAEILPRQVVEGKGWSSVQAFLDYKAREE